MPLPPSDAAESEPSAPAWLARFVPVKASEAVGLLLSFAYFFSVLTAYYILRPIRDEMGVTVGRDSLEHLFGMVFLVMLAAVPVFGWITSRFARRQVVPLVYLFFIANLVLFWIAFRYGETDALIAKTFFVWASVFNLFVVSLFWILMSEFWLADQAKRLYGFISAGGTAGALVGPLITKYLAVVFTPTDLLLVSAAFLAVALAAVLALRRVFAGSTGAGADRPAGTTGLFSGAERVFRSPYLFRIALVIFIANVIGTYFYLEQSRIVGDAIPDRAARVQFFATRDLLVSCITIVLQVFVAARVMEKFGLGVALSVLPVAAITGLLALSVSPTLAVVAAVMVVERALAFSLTSPAIKVLYTAVDTEEKYKAQNFIDTVVYRGGDAAAGYVLSALTKGLGLGAAGIAAVSLPLAAVWLMSSFQLGRMHREKTGAQ